MVFHKGELKESGVPAHLQNDPDSMFAEMANKTPGLKAGASAMADEDSATSGFETSTDNGSQINGFLQ